MEIWRRLVCSPAASRNLNFATRSRHSRGTASEIAFTLLVPRHLSADENQYGISPNAGSCKRRHTPTPKGQPGCPTLELRGVPVSYTHLCPWALHTAWWLYKYITTLQLPLFCYVSLLNIIKQSTYYQRISVRMSYRNLVIFKMLKIIVYLKEILEVIVCLISIMCCDPSFYFYA